MSETPPYFFNPFGINADDLVAIPITGTNTGPVSYQYGYGPSYELDLLTNPSALPIGRGTFNQLMFDTTTLLQQYSQYGVPPFITTSQNQGTPFPYPIYARTYYLGKVYENQVASNTATPGTDTSWLVISGDATGVLTGMVIDFGGIAAPNGYLTCDGSAVSRTTYAPLLSVISQTQTGNASSLSSGIVTGLTNATTTMYVGMAIESANFTSGTVISSITNATTVVMSNNASTAGTAVIQFFNWGNGDGSTTFNVPLLTSNTTASKGGTLLNNPSAQVDVVGQTTGAASYALVANNLPPHTHSITSFLSGIGSGLTANSSTTSIGSATGNNTTTNTAISLLQPTAIVYKIIKT